MSDLFPASLETDRLTLERVCRANVDATALYRIRGRGDDIEEIAEHLPWEPHDSPRETAALLERAEREWNAGTAARYLVRPKPAEDGAGEIAGYAKLEVDWDRRTGTLGIWLRKPYWGRGYSGERADALLALAFERLDLEVVVATHHEGNENSRRAVRRYVERYGGQYEGRLRNRQATADGVADCHRYTITAAQYRGSGGADGRIEGIDPIGESESDR